MRRPNRSLTIIVILLVALILGACQTLPPVVVLTPTPSPVAVIATLMQAVNAGDVEAALALFADDAVVTIVPPPPGMEAGTFTGPEEIRGWLEGLKAMNIKSELEILQVDGGTVTARNVFWADMMRPLGIGPLVAMDVYAASDGRLTSLTSTLTDESLAEMQAAANKALIRRGFEAFNTGDLDAFDEIASPDFVDHFPVPGQAPGPEGFKQANAMFRAAFPDMECAIEDMIAEGDKVMARATCRGTHRGDFAGIPASGNQVNLPGIVIYRVVDGKVTDRWGIFNDLALMMQIGAIPPP